MSQQFGWFKNKYQSGGGATFTPSVNLNEVITANGFQYQATITSNIPNANLLVSMRGTIPESNIVGGSRNTSITTDSFGTATVIKDFETATSNTTFDFQTSVYNPNKLPDLNEATMAQGNVVTLSGTANKRIDVASYSGNVTDIAKSNITVGSDTMTLYQFTVPGTFTFDITSVANVSKEVQVFAVGAGSGAANTTPVTFGKGGGGAGGNLVTGNLTFTDARIVCNATIGAGGVTNTDTNGGRGGGSGIFLHTDANVLVAGADAAHTGLGEGRMGELGQGGSGGGVMMSAGGGGAGGGNELDYSDPSRLPFPQAKGGYLLGGGATHTTFANVIFKGGVDSNLSINFSPSIGNTVPLSYANTSVSGNLNIMGELAGSVGSNTGNIGLGGVDFIHDFTGSNVSYGGGGPGQAQGVAFSRFYSGYGAGGYVGLNPTDPGKNVNVDGKNGIVMIRHIQNGTRALSM